MTGKEYIENAHHEGKQVTHEYSNGLTYVFVRECDGWVSIFRRLESGEYMPMIQASGYDRAKEYIYMRELVPAGVDVVSMGGK